MVISMNTKADFLRECMESVGNGPIDTFHKAFCVMCANRDCSRSPANNSSFDLRMRNWKNDLFDNVPRAEESDPRFARIRAKNFISVNPGVSISTQEPSEPPTQPDHIIPGVYSTEVEIVPEAPLPSEIVLEQVPPEPPQRQDRRQPVNSELGNTPFSQGITLPGYEPPTKQADVIIESGGTFTFGGKDE